LAWSDGVSYSLKHLFVLIAIACIVVNALISPSPFWAFIVVNTAVVSLLAATIGAWMQLLNRAFWAPFCTVAWFYLVVAFIPPNVHRLAVYLPTGQASIRLSKTGTIADLQRFADVVDTLVAMLLGTLAGIIGSALVRRQQEQ
jgi:hypothetical protein